MLLLLRLLITVGILLARATSLGHHHGHVSRAGIIQRRGGVPIQRILTGGAGQIVGFTFNGGSFLPSANSNVSEPGRTTSWLTFKEPNLLYAVDENSNATRLFNYDPSTGSLSPEISSFNGSSGVVHLAFNADKTRLVGSSYGQGQIDVWDSSSRDGSLQLLKQVTLPGTHGPNPGSQSQPRAHQAVLDPTGRYFIINDLGGNALHVFTEDTLSIVNTIPVTPAASGPRHGAFISIEGTAQATHYVVVCELSNTIQLFSVSYDDGTLTVTAMQTISSYGPGLGPANMTSAAAGELAVSHNGPVFIYVSNRLSGNETDNISRFALEAKSETDPTPQLVFKECVSSGGLAPRMFSLSKDVCESVLFVANMNGKNGLVAIKRDKITGTMVTAPLAEFPNDQFSSQAQSTGFGPQFVMEI